VGEPKNSFTTKGTKYMAKLAKRVKANNEAVDADKVYTAEEGIELAKKTANTKFVGSIEVHVRTLIDAKKTDQSVRGTVTLPNGTGKTKKVAAFVTEAKEKEAKDAGAVLVGGEELIKQIKETEKTDFDVAIAEPALMSKLAQIAKILGTRGLMPNPKTGTVGVNVGAMIKEIAGGKVNFKNDDSGNIHQIIGKSNFDSKLLLENMKALIKSVNESKPGTVKGQFIASISVNSTMGPGIKVKM
jgi:large subunit ribosomal protein L1